MVISTKDIKQITSKKHKIKYIILLFNKLISLPHIFILGIIRRELKKTFYIMTLFNPNKASEDC